MRILCFGSLNIDNVYTVSHFVRPGETMDTIAFNRFCGGKGLNQSVAAAKAGGEVYHAGCIGPDGGMLTDVLKNAGVNTDYLAELACPTGHAVIQVNENGQNCILLYGGANRQVTSEQIQRTLSQFNTGDYLILQNEINGLREIILTASKRGLRVVLNPSPMTSELLSLPLDKVDFFLLNEVEAKDLCGAEIPEEEYPAMILRKYPKTHVVLTLGSRGCIYQDGSQRIVMPARKVSAVDTTGAGDTFTGYLIAALASGENVSTALTLATCAAAISVSRPGASSSVPTLDEVKAFSKS